MTAKEALKLAVKAKLAGENYQTKIVLKAIDTAARRGETHLILDDGRICLFEDDYKYFERLGYKVTKPIKKYFEPHNKTEIGHYFYKYGRIDWSI